MSRRGRPRKYDSVELGLELIAVLDSALASPNGIAVATQNPTYLRVLLNKARQSCGSDRYDHLSIILTPEEVWIRPK